MTGERTPKPAELKTIRPKEFKDFGDLARTLRENAAEDEKLRTRLRTKERLQEKAKAAAKAQPPTKEVSPSSEREITEHEAPHADRFLGIAEDAPELAAEYLSLNKEVARLEARKKDIRDRMDEILGEAEVPAMQGEFWIAQVVTSHRAKKISATKLLEEGVNIEVINACYEGGEPYAYITITAKETRERPIVKGEEV